MTIQEDRAYEKSAWCWIFCFTLFRFIYSGSFLLSPDEANYWQWSRHLDWSYHDQAPMIGWAIRAATTLLGNTEFGVRLPSVLAMAVASIYMVAIARRWFGARTAFYTAVLTQSVFEFNLGGLLATADGIQAAGWAGAAYHTARAYEDNRWSQWLAAGFWLGFGLLSKYTMVIFLPGAYLFGLLSADHRQRLAGIRPYAGVLLGLTIFSPVIFWNAAHDWNSVRHVAHIGGAGSGFAIHFKYLGDFIGSQAALLSPLVFLLVFMAWARSLRREEKDRRWIVPYLFWTSFTMFAAFTILSLHTRIYGNWAGATYITVSVLGAAFYGSRKGPDRQHSGFGKKIWPYAVATSYLMTAAILLQVLWPFVPLPLRMDMIQRELVGWQTLGAEVGDLKSRMPTPAKTFIFSYRYQEASQLAFYTPGQPNTVSINKWSRPNVYDYWYNDSDLRGWDGVGVSYAGTDHTGRLLEIFERVDPPVELRIYRKPLIWKKNTQEPPVKTFYLYRAYGFKGGLRWEPPDKSDIRAQ